MKEQSELYTADQLAELDKYCLSSKLYINIPTMTEYSDLKEAIAKGEVDTRISYKVDIGDKDILSPKKLHSANKFLDRLYEVEVDGKAPEKVNFMAWWEPTFKVGYKKLSSRVQIGPVDDLMKPIFDDYLGLAPTGAVETILKEAGAGADFVTLMADAMGRKLSKDTTVEVLTSALKMVDTYIETTYRTKVCPVAFYIGSTGLLPDEYDTKALTAEQLTALYPNVKLSKDEKEGVFYVVGDSILTVYTKAEIFSTGKVEAAPGQ